MPFLIDFYMTVFVYGRFDCGRMKVSEHDFRGFGRVFPRLTENVRMISADSKGHFDDPCDQSAGKSHRDKHENKSVGNRYPQGLFLSQSVIQTQIFRFQIRASFFDFTQTLPRSVIPGTSGSDGHLFPEI